MDMFITSPDRLEQFASGRRVWQGIPGIERTRKGRLFATFYSGGTKEQLGNFCPLILSDDDGATWTEPIAAAYRGEDYRCFDSCLWMDPLGRLWFTWAISPEHAVWGVLCDDPDAATLSWTKPRIIGRDVMLQKPVALTTGEWLFPIAVWRDGVFVLRDCTTQQADKRSFVYRSANHGKTLVKLGGADVPGRSFDEHMVLEMRDGTLRMFVRTRDGIGQSTSYDRGHTWTPGVDTGWGGPCSRFWIGRLRSGNILLVNHYKFKGRSNLTAMLSRDECRSWEGHLLLDGRDSVSYPDVTEDAEGHIYIIYDRDRGGFLHSLRDAEKRAREILLAKVTEQDIFAGQVVGKESFLQRIISKLGRYEGPGDPYAGWDGVTMAQAVHRLAMLSSGEMIVNRIFEDYGRCCINLNDEQTEAVDRRVAKLLAGDLLDNAYERARNIEEIIRILQANYTDEKRADAPDSLVEWVLSQVNGRLDQDITLDEMARELHVSKFYLCHAFKRKTGITIMQYVLSQRIARAKQLLAGTDHTVTEIATRVGFDSAAHFAKVFRALEGTAPRQYRKENALA